MADATIDPITLQVIGGALHSIAEQMGNVLYRMSYSSIIRESQDLGAGLFDRDYNTLCESNSTPMHIGSLPGYLRGIEKSIPLDAWKPGDCAIHNHPYYGASHSPDIAIVMPVFYDGELVGFSANTAHHVDIGSATPGLIIDVPDVFAEGMLFNGIKLYEEGKRNEYFWRYIRDNTRVPGLVMGDLEAQIASAELGVRRFQELLGTYGKDMVFQATRQLMDYTEAMLRREIAKIPDGDYTAEGFLDDDGRNRGKTLPVKVTVRKRGDGVEVDLTGSAPQSPTAFNVPFEGSTKVACYFAFRALLLDTYTHDEHIPQNEGSFRPVKVTAPLGTIYNPIAPVAAEARFCQIQRVVDLIIKALAPVLPDRCTAGNAANSVLRRLFRRPAEWRILGLPRSQRSRDGRSSEVGRPGHGRGTDAQHAQQPSRRSRHAPAADLRPLRTARRRDAGRRPVPRRSGRREGATVPDAGLHHARIRPT